MRSVRRLAAVVMLATTGCTSMQVQSGPTIQIVPTRHPSHIRVVLTNGPTRDVYDGDVAGDSLVGYGAAVGGAGQLNRIALAMADVRAIQLPRPDAERTGVLVAGVLIGSFLVVKYAVRHVCLFGTWDRYSESCRGGSIGLEGL